MSRNADPIRTAAAALQREGRQRGRSWGWNFCQMFTTVTPKEIGGNESYTVSVDVNGMSHALRSVEEAGGKAYTAWWEIERGAQPMRLGYFDDPAEALAHAEKVIADVAAGLLKLDELGREDGRTNS